jgi:hypothetical protein
MSTIRSLTISKRNERFILKRHIAVLIAILAATPLLAHHSVSKEFDSARAMPITGMITRVEWTNPHVWIYLNVKDSDGKTVPWRVEIAAPGALTRAGFEKKLLDLTSPVTIEIWPARDGSLHAAGRLLTLLDGRAFDVADKWPDAIPLK